jgi:hypothetical protein
MIVSRRRLMGAAATIAGAIGSAALTTRVLANANRTPHFADGTPVSKQNAQYQDQPNGQQRCSACANFQAPSACLVVSGTVAPNGWCKLFKAKSA